MSTVIDEAVKALNARIEGQPLGGTAKFVIEDEGAICIENDTAAPCGADHDADTTLTASAETFRDLLEGNANPTGAFMSGQLKVDGDMGLAMKLGSILG